MQLSQEIITASVSSLKTTGTHLFWPVKPSEALSKSIEEFGQMTPVLAMETEDGLELIAGQARAEALRALELPVMVRLVTNANAIDKGRLYLTDNAHRVLDDGMKLNALAYFRPLMDEKTLVSDIFPRLGIKPKSKDAKLFLTWLDLDETWQAHLCSGHVPLAAGGPLSRMDATERKAIEPLFANFSWSRSNAVNILTWLFETAKMQSKSMAEIMEGAGLNAILKEGLSPKDAIAKLTAAGRVARYPELSRLQEEFSRAAREITAGTKWRMTQPNNFETGGSELIIQVKNADQLAKAVKDLEAMSELSPWKTIWNLGGYDD